MGNEMSGKGLSADCDPLGNTSNGVVFDVSSSSTSDAGATSDGISDDIPEGIPAVTSEDRPAGIPDAIPDATSAGISGGTPDAGRGSSTINPLRHALPRMYGTPRSSGGIGDDGRSAAAACPEGLPARSSVAVEPVMSMGWMSSYSMEVVPVLAGNDGEKDGDGVGSITDSR